MEQIEVLTPNGKKTGESKSRKNIHLEGDWHEVIHLWIINSKSQILLQKRSLLKENYPGMMHISAAGHIEFGETPTVTAIRELSEEVGIKAEDNKLKEILFLRAPVVVNNKEVDKEWIHVFMLKTEVDLTQVKVDPSEVESVVFKNIDEMETEINDENTYLQYVPQEQSYYLCVIDEIKKYL